MRIGLPLRPMLGALLLVAACFDPSEIADTDPTEGSEGTAGSSDPTSDATDSSPATTASTTEPSTTAPSTTAPTGVDSTSEGTGDDPPTVTLLVDGSASPPAVTHARRVPLSADASDDGTVTRVEFHDGGRLLAIDDTEPFEAEILLTSLDDGAHSFTARAFDDADQMGESAPVELAVDIEGGGTVASETNLFQMGGISFHPGIGLVHDADDNVIVVGSLSTTGFEVTGVGATSLSPDLSDTNWQTSVPMSLVDGQPQFLTLGQPVLGPAGSLLAIGGNSMGTDGAIDANASIFRLAADGSGALPFVELSSDPMVQNIALAGIAMDPEGNAFLAGPDHEITKIDPTPNGGTLWQSPVGQAWTLADLGGHRIRTDLEGDVIFDVFTCDPDTSTCTLETRKINGFDGNQLWSREIAVGSEDYFMHVGGSVAGPEAQVLTLHGPPLADGGGLHMVLRDEDGNTVEDVVLGGEGDTFSVADLAYDEQGLVVAVGTMLPGGDLAQRQPFAVRFDEAGTVLWQRIFSFGAADDQAMALALDRHGRVVVVGIADIETIFIAFIGDVWVAQLDL